MDKRKLIKLTIIIVLGLLLLTGCMPGNESYTIAKPAGFFSGVWHGWIAPLSLVLSLFDSTKGIYESINTGFWYDFGYYIAIISGFGSLSFFRKKKE